MKKTQTKKVEVKSEEVVEGPVYEPAPKTKVVYSYDYRGEYMGEANADLCQLTEMKRRKDPTIEPVYLLPNYATTHKPPHVTAEGKAAIFDLDANEWRVKNKPIPVVTEVVGEDTNVLDYQELRKREYPPIEEYLDAIVKDDKDAMDEYISKCQAVKKKYPKPSEPAKPKKK